MKEGVDVYSSCKMQLAFWTKRLGLLPGKKWGQLFPVECVYQLISKLTSPGNWSSYSMQNLTGNTMWIFRANWEQDFNICPSPTKSANKYLSILKTFWYTYNFKNKLERTEKRRQSFDKSWMILIIAWGWWN